MTNPADELRAAAQTLMDLADVAQDDLDTGDYWKPYAKATAWRDGLTNGMGGASGDLAAVFSPVTAQGLAGLLRAAAELAVAYPDLARDHDREACDDFACDLVGRSIALARQINAASA